MDNMSVLCLQSVALPQLMQAQQKVTDNRYGLLQSKISRSHTTASIDFGCVHLGHVHWLRLLL